MGGFGPKFLALICFTPLLLFAVTAVLNRIQPPGDRQVRSHVTPFGARKIVTWMGLAVILALRWGQVLSFDTLGYSLYFLIIVNLFAFVNWFVFTITDVSMHVRLMAVLQTEGPLSESEIEKRYNRRVIIGNRVPRLLALGQLAVKDGRYVLIGTEVLRGAAICARMRKLLGIPVEPPIVPVLPKIKTAA